MRIISEKKLQAVNILDPVFLKKNYPWGSVQEYKNKVMVVKDKIVVHTCGGTVDIYKSNDNGWSLISSVKE